MNALLGAVMLVTSYCHQGTRTASGTIPHFGTIAADRGIPFGMRLALDAFPGMVFTVEDRGGAIGPGRLDLWLPNCQQSVAWGRRWVRVWTVPPPEPPAITVELDPAGVQVTPEPDAAPPPDEAGQGEGA